MLSGRGLPFQDIFCRAAGLRGSPRRGCARQTRYGQRGDNQSRAGTEEQRSARATESRGSGNDKAANRAPSVQLYLGIDRSSKDRRQGEQTRIEPVMKCHLVHLVQ